MHNLQDKVRGCFLGIAIGDALGKPTESMSAEDISTRFGYINNYIQNPKHKYFDGDPAGSWTDDTQLSLAIARSFINKGEFDLDSIAEEHCVEFIKSIAGWGKTTREAIGKIVDGLPWRESNINVESEPKRGFGNGIAMKVSPIGLYMALTNPKQTSAQWLSDHKKIYELIKMTHPTSMAVSSGFAQIFAIQKCFLSDPSDFNVEKFIHIINLAGNLGERFLFNTITEDKISSRFSLLEKHTEYSVEKIISDFKGTCYSYDSLPLTYMFFVKNPMTIDSLYGVVNAGGDTDTNGSMIGALLGALHGVSIFPEHLIEGLQKSDFILNCADKFYQKFTE